MANSKKGFTAADILGSFNDMGDVELIDPLSNDFDEKDLSEYEYESEYDYDYESSNSAPLSDRIDKRLVSTISSLRESAEKNINQVIETVSKIDALLIKIDGLLQKVQPPSSGRTRIVYRKEKSSTHRFYPVFVQWRELKGGKWRYKVLSRPVASVKFKGGFLTHRNETVELIRLASVLIKDRSDAIGYLSNLGRGWTQKSRVLKVKEPVVITELIKIVRSVNSIGVVSINEAELELKGCLSMGRGS
jgi:hypothetical protein